MADTDGSLESLMRWCRLGEAGHVNNDKLVVFVAAKDCYAVEKETEQLRKENAFLKSFLVEIPIGHKTYFFNPTKYFSGDTADEAVRNDMAPAEPLK